MKPDPSAGGRWQRTRFRATPSIAPYGVAGLNRKQILVGGAAAAATVGAVRVGTASDNAPEPLKGDEATTILGPRNEPLERKNPDILLPPSTDNNLLPNLKFSFDLAHMRVTDGGWARQVTVEELPIATTVAAWTCGSSRGRSGSCTGTIRRSGR